MAAPTTSNLPVANGTSTELSAAQKLMQKHEAHNPTIEDVVDEEDVIKHGEAPKSTSVLEAVDDVQEAVPTWAPTVSAKAAGKQKATEEPAKEKAGLDTRSHELFPELGGGKAQSAPSVASIWSGKKPAVVSDTGLNGTNGSTPHENGSGPTSGAATPTSASTPSGGPGNFSIPGRHSERISLAPNQLLPRNQMKRPLADVLKDINRKSKATVTVTTGNAGLLWFSAVGPQDACRQALKDVVEQIGAKQSVHVSIPRSARAHIIGKGGSVIKALQEKTGARIQMPKVDPSAAPVDEDDDDATVDILIEGNALAAEMARREVEKIAGERTATVTHRMRGIPAEFYPFIAGPNNAGINSLEEGKNLRAHVPAHHTWRTQPPPQPTNAGEPLNFLPPAPNNHITLAGDRLAVQQARASIEHQAQELRRQLALEQLAINKGRHQFIVGDRGIPVQQFLADTGCSIILPEDSEDETITIIGPSDRLQSGVDKAMDLASSMHSTNVDISRQHRNAPGGATAHARNVTKYLQRRKEIERLERQHDAHIVTQLLQDGVAPWELYSRDGKNTIRAQSEITSIVNGHPPSRMANVPVDPFFHQHLRSDVVPKVQEAFGVYTVVPDDRDSNSPILLVFEGPSGTDQEYQVPRTQPSPAETQAFQKSLQEARDYILNIVSGQEEIKTESVDVPLKFHDRLRKFIKKEQAARPSDQIPVRVNATGSIVNLRGPSSSVDALVAKINDFVVQEISDEKERGFTLSFDFPQKYANQLIGKGGSNIRELRDKFDVEIQVDDGKVVLKGPKAKAEAAKSHIEKLGRQWADESTHILKVDPKYHRELIGAQGNQINKLQTRYKVQIHFPKSARPARDDQSVDAASEAAAPRAGRRQQPEDEVTVRGPSKGADEARDEILSLLQYLKDNSFSATVNVQQSQVPSLIGQGGKALDELRELTGAKIDVPGSRDAKSATGLVEIQVKGTKSQVAAAKKLIEEKKAVFDDTVSKTVEIEKKHHRTLIGAGGSNLRDIIVKAGGSDDRRELARTVQFPRADEDGNKIKVEGNKAVVDKIIAAMLDVVATREAQTTTVIDVPTAQHRTLIGRGGDAKKALESQFRVALDVPARDSGKTGIKISGLPADVALAAEHITELTKQEEGETIMVPRQYHHAAANGGQLFHVLKREHGVTVDHAGHKLPAKPSAKKAANDAPLPLITDAQDEGEDSHTFHTVACTPEEIEGEIPWVLRGDAEAVAKAKAAVATAIEQAKATTTTGYLGLPDPRLYRYVIGQGGQKVNAIRKQSGCTIDVPKSGEGREAIEICGSEEGVEIAKDLILKAVQEGATQSVNRRG
ncbi:hypothetical protein V498_04636 [Pseudogymnoascus sp. VKM F-4517 (FW-2822)]|nr:hypothetical protein V498_04636 [Pseudogymnoascus sp. VKM F-4517 (FW-2822)]